MEREPFNSLLFSWRHTHSVSLTNGVGLKFGKESNLYFKFNLLIMDIHCSLSLLPLLHGFQNGVHMREKDLLMLLLSFLLWEVALMLAKFQSITGLTIETICLNGHQTWISTLSHLSFLSCCLLFSLWDPHFTRITGLSLSLSPLSFPVGLQLLYLPSIHFRTVMVRERLYTTTARREREEQDQDQLHVGRYERF